MYVIDVSALREPHLRSVLQSSVVDAVQQTHLVFLDQIVQLLRSSFHPLSHVRLLLVGVFEVRFEEARVVVESGESVAGALEQRREFAREGLAGVGKVCERVAVMADELAPLAQKHVARPTHLCQRLSVRVATHRLLAAHLLNAGSIAQHGQVDEQVAAREFGFAVSDCALAAEVVSTVQTPTGGCHVLRVDGRTVVTLPHCVRPKSADFNQRFLHVNKITTYLFDAP